MVGMETAASGSGRGSSRTPGREIRHDNGGRDPSDVYQLVHGVGNYALLAVGPGRQVEAGRPGMPPQLGRAAVSRITQMPEMPPVFLTPFIVEPPRVA